MSFSLRSLALYIQPAAGGTNASVTVTAGNLALGAPAALTISAGSTVTLTPGNLALAGGTEGLAGHNAVTLSPSDLTLAGGTETLAAHAAVTLSPSDLALGGGTHTLAVVVVSDSVTLSPTDLALAGNTVTNSAGSSVGMTVGNLALGGGTHAMATTEFVALTAGQMYLGRTGDWTPEVYTDGDALVRWLDVSQNGVQVDNTILSELDDAGPNATPVGAFGHGGADAPRIQTNEINGLPIIRFGGSQFLDTEGDIGIAGDQFTFIHVYKRTNASQNDDFWTSTDPNDTAFSAHFTAGWDAMTTFSSGGTVEHTFAYNQSTDTNFNIRVEVFNRDSSFGRYNGSEPIHTIFGVDDDMTGASIANGLTIGWDAGTGGVPMTANAMHGDLAEFAILGHAASLSEVEQWEGYLAHKYALTASLPSNHPYKTTAPSLTTVHTLTGEHAIILTAGNMALAGGSHALVATEFVDLEPGDLALAGNTVTEVHGGSVALTVGNIALAGGAHTVVGASSVTLTVGDLALGGGTVDAAQASAVALTVGDLALGGGTHTLSGASVVALTAGDLDLAGAAVAASAGSSVAIAPGDLALDGNGAVLNEEVGASPPFVFGTV